MRIVLVFLFIAQLSFSYINVYPVKFIERVDNGGTSQKFVFYNKSEQKVRYRFYFEESNKKNDMSKWCRLSLTSIELNPLEKKEITFFCKAPEEVQEGRYLAKLVIKEVEVVTKDGEIQRKNYLTKLVLNLVGYVGEKGIFKLKKSNLNLEGVNFLDINDGDLIFSKSGKTYRYGLNRGKIEKALDGEIIERVNDRYLCKSEKQYSLKDLNFLDRSSQYDEITNSGSVGLFIINRNSMYGVIDKDGKIIIEPKYEKLDRFKGGFSIFQIKGKKGVIDKEGNIRLNSTFQELYISKNGNWIGDKNGAYLTSNRKALKIERIFPSRYERLVYEKDGSYGVIDLINMRFTENIYKSIGTEIDNGLVLGKNKKFSLLNSNEIFEDMIGKIEYSYDYILKVDEDIYALGDLKKRKLKYINLYSGNLIDTEFEEIVRCNSNLVKGSLGKKEYFIRSRDGKIIEVAEKGKIKFINKRYILSEEKDNYRLLNIQEI